MDLRCLADFAGVNPHTGERTAYRAGQMLALAPRDAEWLLRASPESFVTEPHDEPMPAPASQAEFLPEVEAQTTETPTGIRAVDRRQRGGRRR